MNTVPLRLKLCFGAGQTAEGIKSYAFGNFLFWYYSQILGLTPWAAGLAGFLGLLFDAVTDPIVGSISDNFRHRWGRRHPFLLASAIPLAVCFSMLFQPPDDLSQTGLFTWFLCWAVLARASMTLFQVPYMALGAELSQDYHERTRIVAIRTMFSIVGVAMVIGIVFPLIFQSQELDFAQLDPDAYPTIGYFFGAVMAFVILFSALTTREVIPRLPQPLDGTPSFSFGRVFREFLEALSNPSFRRIFIGMVLFFTARGVQDSLNMHMGTYFWKLDSGQLGIVAAAIIPGVVIGIPFWAQMSRRIEKRNTFVIGLSLLGSVTVLTPVAKLVGFFPAESSGLYLPLLQAMQFLGAFGAAAGLVVAGSMLADLVDEHELKTGRRQEGIFFASLSFATKFMFGMGQFISGIVVSNIGFPAQAEPGAVSESIVTALAIAWGPGMALLAGTAVIFVSGYRLDRRRHDAIRQELANRATRSAAESQAP